MIQRGRPTTGQREWRTRETLWGTQQREWRARECLWGTQQRGNSNGRLEVTESGVDTTTSGTSTKSEIENTGPQGQPIDPDLWPGTVSQSFGAEAVRRGPFQVRESHVFPKNTDGRASSHSLFYRKMPNGEKVKRSWLTYSEVNDAAFCFSCKLFSTQVIKLIKGGSKDWKNIHIILRSHENCSEYVSTMQKSRELELRFKTGQTIDQQQMILLKEERQMWENVLTKLLGIIQSFAERI